MSSSTSYPQLLTKEVRAEIDHWVAKYPAEQKQSAVIPALNIVQEAHEGWLSEDMMDAVAEYLGMPKVSVYEVATFYSMLQTKPVGRHKISLCKNISCMLRGADKILAHMEKRLGIKIGETTADGRITLIPEEECLAACVGGPMMAVDGHYHENLTLAKVDAILDGLE